MKVNIDVLFYSTELLSLLMKFKLALGKPDTCGMYFYIHVIYMCVYCVCTYMCIIVYSLCISRVFGTRIQLHSLVSITSHAYDQDCWL